MTLSIRLCDPIVSGAVIAAILPGVALFFFPVVMRSQAPLACLAAAQKLPGGGCAQVQAMLAPTLRENPPVARIGTARLTPIKFPPRQLP